MVLQEKTAELFSAFIVNKSAGFNSTEEDFLDNYKKIYNLINFDAVSTE